MSFPAACPIMRNVLTALRRHRGRLKKNPMFDVQPATEQTLSGVWAAIEGWISSQFELTKVRHRTESCTVLLSFVHQCIRLLKAGEQQCRRA